MLSRSTEIIDDGGIDYVLYTGVGKDGHKIILVGMRTTGKDDYNPVIEMDVDLASFWRDTISGELEKTRGTIPPPGKN